MRLEIQRLAFGGDGVAHLADGKIVFVRGGLPGDLVEVTITQEKKRFARGQATEVIRPSSGRIPSSCPHVDAVGNGCGGCRFQTADYAHEWAWKSEAALESFVRAARVNVEDVSVVRHPAQSHEGYRRRLRLTLDAEGRTGFLGHGSHDIQGDAATCPVAHPALREAAGALNWRGPGAVLLELDADDVSVVAALDVPKQEAPPTAEPPLIGLRSMNSGRTAGTPAFHVSVDGMPRNLPVGVFTQAHGSMNEVLVQRVLAATEPQPGQQVLELYCGAGNFTLSLARHGANVCALDVGKDAIDAGQRAAKDHGLDEMIRFERANLRDGIPPEVSAQTFDTVLLDPPRTGAAEVIDDLVALGAPTIVYVSCDAATAGRDVGRLLPAGWTLRQVELVDIFPRTHHVELIAKLVAPPPS